jgi:hypothetical protein
MAPPRSASPVSVRSGARSSISGGERAAGRTRASSVIRRISSRCHRTRMTQHFRGCWKASWRTPSRSRLRCRARGAETLARGVERHGGGAPSEVRSSALRGAGKAGARATAVLFEEERLTYRELNRRANRLGKHLRRLGVDRVTWSAWGAGEMTVGCSGSSRPAQRACRWIRQYPVSVFPCS